MKTSILLASAFAAGITAWMVIRNRAKKTFNEQIPYKPQHHLTNVFARAKPIK